MADKKNTIGRFEIQEKIGEGPIGAVYKALDPVIRRTVAIKVIKLYALEETTTFADVFEKIYRVVRTSTSLNHPNICVIYDLSEEKKIPYITMEYIDGQDLDTSLQKKRQFKREELLSILQQAADAIDFAHKKNVIHQDLKSTNILLTPDLHVKITDFGIAGLDEIAAAQTKKLLSIPFYISPEQALGEKLSPASDLFSLGIIIYQLLAGELPFPGASAASVVMMIARDEQVVPKNLENANISRQQWDSFFNRALSKSPEQRFQSAKEMVDALAAMLPADDSEVYPFPVKQAAATFITDPASSAPTVYMDAAKILDEMPKSAPAASTESEAQATIISRKIAQEDLSLNDNTSPFGPGSMVDDDVSETISVSKEKLQEAKAAMEAEAQQDEPPELPKTQLISNPILPQQPADSAATIISNAKPFETPAPVAPPKTGSPTPTPIPQSKQSAEKTVMTGSSKETAASAKATAAKVGQKSTAAPSTSQQMVVQQPAKTAGPPAMKKYLIAAIGVAFFIVIVGGLILWLKGGKPEAKKEEPPAPVQVVTPKATPPKPQTVEFVATTGQISITSEPVGATVFVGDEQKGVTPLVLADLPIGKYVLKLQMKGYQDLQQEVEITGENKNLNVPVTLEKETPQVGTLVIESTPPGAAIIMNKRAVGVTPKTLTNMKASKYTITLKLDGHDDYTGTVRVKSNETATLEAKMVEIYKPPPPPEPKPVAPAAPKVTPGMLVQLGQPGVVPPKSIKKVPARYPEAAKQRRLEGVVGLSILVSETGKVVDVKVVKSANAMLDDAAVEAVKQWTYEPATKDGVPVKVWTPVSMSFQRSR